MPATQTVFGVVINVQLCGLKVFQNHGRWDIFTMSPFPADLGEPRLKWVQLSLLGLASLGSVQFQSFMGYSNLNTWGQRFRTNCWLLTPALWSHKEYPLTDFLLCIYLEPMISTNINHWLLRLLDSYLYRSFADPSALRTWSFPLYSNAVAQPWGLNVSSEQRKNQTGPHEVRPSHYILAKAGFWGYFLPFAASY